MDKEKVRLIIRNLESLIGCLKEELDEKESSPPKDSTYESVANYLTDYDEVFYEYDD